jgi:hypothetical protein
MEIYSEMSACCDIGFAVNAKKGMIVKGIATSVSTI